MCEAQPAADAFLRVLGDLGGFSSWGGAGSLFRRQHTRLDAEMSEVSTELGGRFCRTGTGLEGVHRSSANAMASPTWSILSTGNVVRIGPILPLGTV